MLLHSTGSPIRLVNGTDTKEGRVEIFHSNQWYTVCDEQWDDSDAAAVCKQLDYPGGFARSNAFFGQGTGRILLNNVSCNGDELSIFLCQFTLPEVNGCTHHEDVGVICNENGMQIILSFYFSSFLIILLE